MTSPTLQDRFARAFPYLRLSITDVCNFRCQYCLPNGYHKQRGAAGFLSLAEIERLLVAFVSLGLRKVRITGGEPTVRKDFADIAKCLSAWSQIERRAFTTNGYRLRDNASKWRDCGLNSVNISVDSLDAQVFSRLTGHDKLEYVLAGVQAALDVGFPRVKLNAVLHRGIHDNGLDEFFDYVRDRPIGWQFIELMETGDGRDYFKQFHLPASIVIDKLSNEGWIEEERDMLGGPARLFSHPNYAGTIGVIAPYARDFCASCNRLRVTARGDLRLCLFGSWGVPLRHLLQSDDSKEELVRTLQQQLRHKEVSHRLHSGNVGITQHLASIGG